MPEVPTVPGDRVTRNLADTVVQILWPAIGLVSRLLPARLTRWLNEPPEPEVIG